MTIPVIGLGAGGHAKVIIEILQSDPRYKVIGLLDIAPELQDVTLLDVPVLGSDELLPQLVDRGVSLFFVGLGGVGKTTPRRRLYEFALAHAIQPVDVIHRQSIRSPSAHWGKGVTLMACVVINADSCLGDNVIINTGAIVEHDCTIGNHVHIATGARLAGGVQVGDGAHVGAGATVRQCITIGKDALVGAGAVVVKDVAPGTTVIGVPAVPYKRMLTGNE